MIRQSPKERFWAKVDTSGECWEWTACKDRDGYPKITISGKVVTATRYAYRIQNGNFDDKLCILHKCDNPGCVRGSHLYIGTHAENMHDMRRKRRSTWGSRSASAKLTNSAIPEIKKLNDDGLSQRKIARLYGVAHGTIAKIIHGVSWRYLHV